MTFYYDVGFFAAEFWHCFQSCNAYIKNDCLLQIKQKLEKYLELIFVIFQGKIGIKKQSPLEKFLKQLIGYVTMHVKSKFCCCITTRPKNKSTPNKQKRIKTQTTSPKQSSPNLSHLSASISKPPSKFIELSYLIYFISNNNSNILRMEMINSKAFYLKHFSKRLRSKTQPKETEETIKQNRLKLNQVESIRKLMRNQRKRIAMPHTAMHKSKSKGQQPSNCQTDSENEHPLFFRIYGFKKNEALIGKWHSFSFKYDSKQPNFSNSIQLDTMRPTNRFFNKVDNIKEISKLLLAQPSKGLNRFSQSKFYSHQQTSQPNRSKLSTRIHDSCKKDHKKKLHLKKWID